MAKEIVVGVDLGGTSLLAVTTNVKGKILGENKRKTLPEEGASAVSERMVKSVREAVHGAGLRMKDVCAVGIGAPGPLNPKTGIIFHAPNLGPTWNNLPIATMLSKQLECPVYLANDVDVGAVGEHAFGAGHGYENMVALFIGTGIGGGIVLNGKLYRGSRYTAGEVGHTILLADGPLCGCGRRGCAEALASRTAIEREIRAAIAAGRDSMIPSILQNTGQDTMSSSIIGTALEQGDALTQEVMAKAEYYMGLLVANVVNILDPQVVVLGGGMVERFGRSYVEPVHETAERYYLNQQDKDKVHVVETKLKGYAGALGAATLALRSWKRGQRRHS